MKRFFKSKLLLILALSAGILGLVLRVVLYASALDEKGLLIPGHWASTGLWILTGIVFAALVVLTRDLTGPRDHRPGRSPAATLGCAAAGIALAGTAAGELISRSDTMPVTASILTLAGGACLLAAGLCRARGRKPHSLLYVVLCLAFALRMICLYRSWSPDPQILDYCFYTGAYVSLMLLSYEQAALCCAMGSPRKLWLYSLLAIYLCLVAAWNCPAPQLLLGCALWCATGLPRPRRKGAAQ